MKKVIFALVLGGLVTTLSCSSEKENHAGHDHKEGHEHNDGHAHSDGHDHHNEDHEEEIQANFPVDGYEFYGMAEVKPKNAVTVEEMVAKVYSKGTFDGDVLAILDGVCKKKGCWVTMTNKNGESVRVRFKDHFGIPTDTPEGVEVVLRGVATIDTTSIDLQKHFLDDAKEAGEEVTQEQYDNITEDIIEISFISDGVLVKK